MGSILSLYLPAAPETASKASQTEWNCPVCHSVQSDTDAVPCGHRFCLGCLLRHTATSPTCPLCASPLLSARFSVLGHNDFLQCILSPPGVPLGPAGWARRALFHLVYTRPGPTAPQPAPAPAEPAGEESEEGFPADMWTELLHGQEHLLDPVRPWLRQSLDAIYGPQWWEARQVESIALSTLCICGPDSVALTHMLQSYLREYTAPLVHGLIHVTMHRCRDAWALRRSPAAQEAESSADSPGPGPSPSPGPALAPGPGQAPGPALAPARPGVGDPPGSPAAPGAPWYPLPAPGPQEQPQAVPDEAAPAPGPSAPWRGRNRRPRPIRRSYRRRACRYRRPLRFRGRKPKRK